MPEDTKKLPVGMPWWVGIVATALMSAALTWDATESAVWTIVALCSVFGATTGGVVVYRRRGGSRKPTAGVLSVLLSFSVGFGLVALLAAMSGCGAGVQQRIVSGAAVAAVVVRDGAGTWYEAEEQITLDEFEEAGKTEAEYCVAMQPTWEVVARIQCYTEAVAEAARAAESALSIAGRMSEGAWTEWLRVVGHLVAALGEAWEATGKPVPAVLSELRLLIPLTGVDASGHCDIGPVPGCETVLESGTQPVE